MEALVKAKLDELEAAARYVSDPVKELLLALAAALDAALPAPAAPAAK